jgi:hypothetical protein
MLLHYLYRARRLTGKFVWSEFLADANFEHPTPIKRRGIKGFVGNWRAAAEGVRLAPLYDKVVIADLVLLAKRLDDRKPPPPIRTFMKRKSSRGNNP